MPRPQIPVLMDDELSSESDSDVESETQTCELNLLHKYTTCTLYNIAAHFNLISIQ